jgi:RHH-type proline utilization regulon transcriptional repressor/proline dehydrogenase/delta 1-pyrroline-5-carboxylate dehydrogenase
MPALLGTNRRNRPPQGRSAIDLDADSLTAIQNSPPAAFFLPDTRKRMQAALEDRRRHFGTHYPLLIGDEELHDRPEAPVEYPAEPHAIVGLVAQGNRDDVDAAVGIARSSFPSWRDTPATERASILRRAAEIVEARRFDLSALMVFESGKPWHEADGDVSEAADYLRYYAAQAEALGAPRRLGRVPGEHNEYFHVGRGVAAVIAPWNFPLAIICGMSVGALAGGNAAILKPAGQSPIIAHELVRILREAGVPPAVVQYLPGAGSKAGQALVEHPGVDIVAFTGSSAVGLGIIQSAAATPFGQANVKHVIAEMGGKNAIIIDEDADLDQAVAGVVTSAFGYAGQKCSACSRLIVVGSAYDEAVSRLAHAVESLVAGPPHLPESFVPPVISEGARPRSRAMSTRRIVRDALAGMRRMTAVTTSGPRSSPMCPPAHRSPGKRCSARCWLSFARRHSRKLLVSRLTQHSP